jgi:hypothetical protein
MKNIITLLTLVVLINNSFAGCGYNISSFITTENKGFPLKLILGGKYPCNNTYANVTFYDSQNEVINSGNILEINQYGTYYGKSLPFGVHNIILFSTYHVIDSTYENDYILIKNTTSLYGGTSYFYGKTVDAFNHSKTIDEIEIKNNTKIQLLEKVKYLKNVTNYFASKTVSTEFLDSNKTDKIKWYRNAEFLKEGGFSLDISTIYTGYFFAEITTTKGYTYNTDTIFCDELSRIYFDNCIDSNLTLLSKCDNNRKNQLQNTYSKLFLPKANPILKNEYYDMLVCDKLEIEIILFNYMGLEVYRRKKIYNSGLNKVCLFDDYDGVSGYSKMVLIVNDKFSTTRNIIIQN